MNGLKLQSKLSPFSNNNTRSVMLDRRAGEALNENRKDSATFWISWFCMYRNRLFIAGRKALMPKIYTLFCFVKLNSVLIVFIYLFIFNVCYVLISACQACNFSLFLSIILLSLHSFVTLPSIILLSFYLSFRYLSIHCFAILLFVKSLFLIDQTKLTRG